MNIAEQAGERAGATTQGLPKSRGVRNHPRFVSSLHGASGWLTQHGTCYAMILLALPLLMGFTRKENGFFKRIEALWKKMPPSANVQVYCPDARVHGQYAKIGDTPGWLATIWDLSEDSFVVNQHTVYGQAAKEAIARCLKP